MSSELVINCRHLTGTAPLWMLYQASRHNPQAGVRLVVSQEETAREVMAALADCGLHADLDPIGGEFHIICRGASDVGPAIGVWLSARERAAAGRRL